MRPELQAKLLQHLNKKKADRGFTLVELLVVIVIIGILAAVALPNFLSQSAKAKQSEGKQYVSMYSRSQTAFRTDKTKFASSYTELAIGSLKDLTGSTGYMSSATYEYSMTGTTDSATILAESLDTAVKPYNSHVQRYNSGADSESVIASVVCEEKTAKSGAAGAITMSTGAAPTCNASATDLSQK